jgi:hypothetical protein
VQLPYTFAPIMDVEIVGLLQPVFLLSYDGTVQCSGLGIVLKNLFSTETE